MIRTLACVVLFVSVSCGDSGGGAAIDGASLIDSTPVPDGDNVLLSDEFLGVLLDPSWEVFRPELVDLQVSAGSLQITPNQQILWFNQSQGPLVYKLISGNFKVSGSVQARRATDITLSPDQRIHLGGLMARKPVAVGNGGQEDYVFVVVGFDVDDLSVETKNTDDGYSEFLGPSWPNSDAELRLCRIGSTFRMYKRALGDNTWMLATTYDRPDMPTDLQVGAVTYANTTTPDLLVVFDWIRFAPAANAADCTVD